MAELHTVSGDVLLLDEEDVPLLENRRLYTLRTRRLTYAYYPEKRDGKQRSVLAHRVIMGAAPSTQVDHINGNGLDCRRENLRIATYAQNAANRRAESTGSSRFKGVTRIANPDRYMARLRTGPDQVILGTFTSEETAARVYDRAALDTWGEFARLNFPNDPPPSAEEIAAARLTTFQGKSRYRGVAWETRKNCWTVAFKANGKHVWVGRFANEEDAAHAYDRACWAVTHDLKRLNFPDEYRQIT